MTKNEFEVLQHLACTPGRHTQRQIADGVDLSLGVVNKLISTLEEQGLLTAGGRSQGVQVTKEGLAALEPYRVKRAVILAAGFGSRLVPITLNTPKPLVQVHGKMIIETLLDAIVAAGIEEIVIVRGYLADRFDVLLNKYPNIRFLYNPIYNESNNISSAILAKDLLQNAYICEADLIIQNPGIIRRYEYAPNCLGVYTEYTDDWCSRPKKGYVHNYHQGGTDCYEIKGIYYWDKPHGVKLAARLEEVFHAPAGKEHLWENVPFNLFPEELPVLIRPCQKGDIVEIDSFSELKAIDPIYDV